MTASAPQLQNPGLLTAGDLLEIREAGGKAANLARLEAAGFPVPRWLALLPDLLLDSSGQAEVRTALAGAGLLDARLAVRSSALAEDGAEASFAGQFRTHLGVPAREEALWEAIADVRASGRTRHAAAYAERLGTGTVSALPVILQEMVPAAVSGVAFTADPVTGRRDHVVLSAVRGLGDRLVSGAEEGDTYRVDRLGKVEGGGITLTHSQAALLADFARRIESEFGLPQDIEWALDPAGRPWILQTRPITHLPPPEPPPPSGERRLWDNSNIVESYGGLTTPLTFSFARGAYEQAYLQLCSVLGVENHLLERNADVFAHMLGYLRGRVYYNLLNWYRALALLPGYSFNRAFMERMMGVRQKLEDPPETPYATGRARDLLRLARMVYRLLREQRRLPGEVRRFHARVDAVLKPYDNASLEDLPADELAALYLHLERELLREWRAPLVNDFLAMIYFGALARMVERWLSTAPPTLVNDLLIGQQGIVSTEPAERIRHLADEVSHSPALLALFERSADDRETWDALQTTGLAPGLHDYLRRFADRCAAELKLETVTPRQEPWQIVGMIRRAFAAPAPDARAGGAARKRAEEVVSESLSGMRAWVFRTVLARTRDRVRDRENLRFERTRVFGLTRRIFLALGARFTELGALPHPRDVFWLTREEVLGAVHGAAPTLGLRALVRARREQLDGFAAEPPLPDRFETFGPPEACLEQHRTTPSKTAIENTEHLQGTGCCPGIVRARVRIVHDPAAPGDLTGRIMVAERTDPGWTLLFPAAAGLLVQRGSLLSHSAIVAREVGLPCVVSIPGLLQRLRDGDEVEMDGATGEVRVFTP